MSRHAEEMSKFIAVRKKIADIEQSDFYKNALHRAGNIFTCYWDAYRPIIEEVTKKTGRIYSYQVDYDIRNIIRDSKALNTPFGDFIRELACEKTLADMLDIDISSCPVEYDDIYELFFVHYDDNYMTEDPISYTVCLKGQDILNATEPGYIEKQVEDFREKLNEELAPYFDGIKASEKQSEYETYLRLKNQFEPDTGMMR